MTEQLRTLMDRAADQDFATVDLDAITGAGDRTVRRRRIGAGVAGVAAVAVIAGGVALLGGDDGNNKTDFVDDPFRTEVPLWTEGRTLHTPDGTIDLGVDVASFVRTSEGIVFLGLQDQEDFTLGVYSFTGEDAPERIGVTQDSRLRSDPDSPYVGWLEGVDEGVETVVYVQRTGQQVWSEDSEPDESLALLAIDGDSAYVSQDAGPTLSVDLASGESTPVPGLGSNQRLQAIEGDLVAYFDEGAAEERTGLLVGPVGVGGVEVSANGSDGAVFSPDGRWISVFGEQVEVHDTATGDRVEVAAGGFPNGLGFDWLDDDTLLAIAGSEDGEEIALLGCEIPAGTCDEVTQLGGFEDGELFSISFGEAIWTVTASGEDGGSVDVEVSTVPPPSETSSTDRPE